MATRCEAAGVRAASRHRARPARLPERCSAPLPCSFPHRSRTGVPNPCARLAPSTLPAVRSFAVPKFRMPAKRPPANSGGPPRRQDSRQDDPTSLQRSKTLGRDLRPSSVSSTAWSATRRPGAGDAIPSRVAPPRCDPVHAPGDRSSAAGQVRTPSWPAATRHESPPDCPQASTSAATLPPTGVRFAPALQTQAGGRCPTWATAARIGPRDRRPECTTSAPAWARAFGSRRELW